MTKAGAYACVLATAVCWLWLFARAGFGADRNFLFLGMMPVATIISASTIALVAVSLMTSPPSAATIRKFFGNSPGVSAGE